MGGNLNPRQEHSKKRAARLPSRKLLPLNPIIVVRPTEVETLPRDMVRFDEVGWKAYGLSAMPYDWVPRFFVIHPDCLKDKESPEKLPALIREAISQAGIVTAWVIVRSSGTAETIQYRGKLESAICSLDKIPAAIKDCREKSDEPVPGTVYWIVQEYVQPRRKGHLSNERHVSKEKRDWVAELELNEDSQGYSIPIAVRRWRDADRISDLRCTSELEISFCLKRVAIWAERLLSRMHFEWVWNGSTIRMVQADIADSVGGVDPLSLVPTAVPEISIKSVSVFKTATSRQFHEYAKLRNVKLYRDLGYEMPPFYVLDEPKQMSEILGGAVSPSLKNDLTELTKRPLILRTDGVDIPTDKREMLPRSDELRTADEARDWLLGPFRNGVQQRELQRSRLCLIGHHFIPSVASAWARAEPGKRIVRVEALWGLPDGLHWYSHDTYEVDTRDVALKASKRGDALDYYSWERLRYKGTFIAPDEAGNWIPHRTKAPFDWRSSIRKRDWLFEIARTTRLVAERERFAVAVMWLIGNPASATSHPVLPWFHTKSELDEAPRAAPRKKFTSSGEIKLHSVLDWESLKSQVASGKRIERVVVEPTDSDLIRNDNFARDLAAFAVANQIVVELAGGVLTHAYYILHRDGTQIECTDLFGAEEEVLEFNKLVRDKIPAIIESRGERVEVVRLTGDALTSALRQKLVEEALEALDAKSGDDLVAELADVEEVIAGLRHALTLGKTQVEANRVDKLKHRGGFQRGYMLTRTSTPHSLRKKGPLKEETLGLEPKDPEKLVISRAADIPTTPPYRRPDLLQTEQRVEKLFVFEAEINNIPNVTETVDFTLPMSDGNTRDFSLAVEIRRNKSSLRGTVRLRVRPDQLLMEFPDTQLHIEFPK
jgi:predicted house-cleaning noncanonical NTP pyrophosphatase (MazG superfamily)